MNFKVAQIFAVIVNLAACSLPFVAHAKGSATCSGMTGEWSVGESLRLLVIAESSDELRIDTPAKDFFFPTFDLRRSKMHVVYEDATTKITHHISKSRYHDYVKGVETVINKKSQINARTVYFQLLYPTPNRNKAEFLVGNDPNFLAGGPITRASCDAPLRASSFPLPQYGGAWIDAKTGDRYVFDQNVTSIKLMNIPSSVATLIDHDFDGSGQHKEFSIGDKSVSHLSFWGDDLFYGQEAWTERLTKRAESFHFWLKMKDSANNQITFIYDPSVNLRKEVQLDRE